MNAQWFTLPMSDPAGPNRHNDRDYSEAVRQLNSLLRGEISAAETYRMAIDKLIEDERDPGQVAILRELQRDHIRAASIFRKRIAELGEASGESSGAWGAWAKVAMGTAQLFGDNAALRALKDGEDHGLKEMRLSVENLDAESAELVEKGLIPAQERHIHRISSLIDLISL
jgi:hypothetical protein